MQESNPNNSKEIEALKELQAYLSSISKTSQETATALDSVQKMLKNYLENQKDPQQKSNPLDLLLG